MRYRKKPIVIHAEQMVDGKIIEEDFIHEGLANGILYYDNGNLYCRTLEGDMWVKPLNYIIQGIHNELYPCDMDIFEESFEEVT